MSGGNKRSIEERLKRLEEQHIVHATKLDNTRKILRDIESLVSTIDETQAKKQISAFKERLLYLSTKLEAAILKHSVFTEVTQIYPNMLKHLVCAFDNTDDWWLKGKHFTIADWERRLIKEFKYNDFVNTH